MRQIFIEDEYGNRSYLPECHGLCDQGRKTCGASCNSGLRVAPPIRRDRPPEPAPPRALRLMGLLVLCLLLAPFVR